MKSMSIRFSVGAWLLALAALAVAPSRVYADRYAVVVGINEYPGGNALNGCVNDANNMKAYLVQHGFPEQNIQMVLDKAATKKGILDALDKVLVQKSKAGDVVVFFYSGHGTYVPDGNGDEPDGTDEALCPVDAESIATLLLDDEMKPIVDRLADRQSVYMFDSCHSGSGLRLIDEKPNARGRFLPPSAFGISDEAINKARAQARSRPPARRAPQMKDQALDALFPGGKGRAPSAGGLSFSRAEDLPPSVLFVAGCKSDETSQEFPQELNGQMVAQGAMTVHLLKALRGEADTNNDQVITGLELKLFFQKTFPLPDSGSPQNPQIEGQEPRLALAFLPGEGGPGGPTPTPAPTATQPPSTQPQATPGEGEAQQGKFLKLLSPIVIGNNDFSEFYDMAPAGQDVKLGIAVEATQQPPAGAIEVASWSFFDAAGTWLPDRESILPGEAKVGKFIYSLAYRAPENTPGEYVLFNLLWFSPEESQILDRVGSVRPIVAQQPGQPQAARMRGALPLSRATQSAGLGGDAAGAVASVFVTRPGQGGLRVSIDSRQEDSRVRFALNATRDCYAILLNLSTRGRLTVLAPRDGDKPLRLRRGDETVFPSGGQALALSGPEGLEWVAVLALEKPARISENALETARAWVKAGCAAAVVSIPVRGEQRAALQRQERAIPPGMLKAPGKPEAKPQAKPEGPSALDKLFEKK